MTAATIVGTIIAGTITDRFGVVAVLTFQGAGYIVAGVLLLTLLPPGRPTAADAAALKGRPEAPAQPLLDSAPIPSEV